MNLLPRASATNFIPAAMIQEELRSRNMLLFNLIMSVIMSPMYVLLDVMVTGIV